MVQSLTVAWGDGELVADCVEDAFERAYVRWRRVSRYDAPVAWVRRVAINRLRDHHRRAERQTRVVRRLGADLALAEGERGADAGYLDDDLYRELLALPQQQRTAVALHYLEGLRVAEIAESMDIAEGTVKSHLSDGRAALRRCLSGSLEGMSDG